MSSGSRILLPLALAALAAGSALTGVAAFRRAHAPPPPPSPLRVCADPNNLPFSDAAGGGFENELARLLAADLGTTLAYTWFPQRRGFIRNTLNTGECDVVMGVPTSFELALATNPYYRSTYVFVQRADAPHRIASMDDPALRKLRVGVPVVGDDYGSTPGAAALARRGITANVKGYSVYGDYDRPHPPSAVIEAVARGEVDVAIAWGPLAGFFARRDSVPLVLTPVSPQVDLPFTPFVFDIAMAVRRGDDSLRTRLDDFIARRQPEISALLERYGVPVLRTGAFRAAPPRQESQP